MEPVRDLEIEPLRVHVRARARATTCVMLRQAVLRLDLFTPSLQPSDTTEIRWKICACRARRDVYAASRAW